MRWKSGYSSKSGFETWTSLGYKFGRHVEAKIWFISVTPMFPSATPARVTRHSGAVATEVVDEKSPWYQKNAVLFAGFDARRLTLPHTCAAHTFAHAMVTGAVGRASDRTSI